METDNFDFKDDSEEPEQLDFSKTTNCPHCMKPIPKNSTMCLYCGDEVDLAEKTQWIKWAVTVIVIIFLAAILLR
ncbi:MAG: hypothetical protein ABH872_07185 [Candidatus Omnitrophota bacterium]